jgi:hypothetical protein
MHTSRFKFIFIELSLEVVPEVFNGIEVWGLGRPIQEFNIVVLTPFPGNLGVMF